MCRFLRRGSKDWPLPLPVSWRVSWIFTSGRSQLLCKKPDDTDPAMGDEYLLSLCWSSHPSLGTKTGSQGAVLGLLIPANTPRRKMKIPDIWPQSSHPSSSQLFKKPQLWPQTSCIRLASCPRSAGCNP